MLARDSAMSQSNKMAQRSLMERIFLGDGDSKPST